LEISKIILLAIKTPNHLKEMDTDIYFDNGRSLQPFNITTFPKFN